MYHLLMLSVRAQRFCCTYPCKVFHVVDGRITDTPTLVKIVKGRGVAELQLFPLLLTGGTSQHGVEDVEVSLHWVLTHNAVLLEQVFG